MLESGVSDVYRLTAPTSPSKADRSYDLVVMSHTLLYGIDLHSNNKTGKVWREPSKRGKALPR